MNIYTIGRLVFPYVVGILSLSAILTVLSFGWMVFRMVTSLRHLSQPLGEAPDITITILEEDGSSTPPMQETGC
ncbi:MAG: hypothetical protein PHQ40_08670 [Anaerolineaceae bacterium]|nr:hypothetical protein [Anaerolineaceae bacterium]